ncbi:SulP family inorganic anion transporter [Arthrobacter bambusae]|uniref:SulP family inorganic anion transporter n=1 Tax=Arthrobacter bambusae TaxID=1338426 RepID=UPI00277E7F89|nr:SulP family inorganic anion transporter [Arthrobacter bambusae]MDQ0028699.1 high affinity sulfate transporter 1 [Arthrobacter bambusae]MDQ0096507.1 high affinity sulfate transporter 1 [Arthrobacter bambusae]
MTGLPGAALLRDYRLRWLGHDVLAGASLSTLLVPAGMAYAQAAGLPPAMGLNATIASLLAYALVGPSRVMVLGPDSALAPMIAAAVLPLAGGGIGRAPALAGLLGVLIGLVLLAGALLRFGVVAGFLSTPIRLGYLQGIAFVVAASQLPAWLGLAPVNGTAWERLAGVASQIIQGKTNVSAVGVGLGALALIWIPRFTSRRIPGVLLAVAASCAMTSALGLQSVIHVVGPLPKGLPGPQLGELSWTDAGALLPVAVGIAIIVFADTSVLSQTLASREGRRVSGNHEMAALGAANVAAGLFGGFPVSASASRTPVAIRAGGKTQITGAAGAVFVLVFMLLAPGLTAYLPTSTLAAVVLAAAVGLIDTAAVRRLYRMSRSEFVLMLVAFAAVTTVGVLTGILVAIGLALLGFIARAWDPYTAELGALEDVPGYHDLARHPEGHRVPGIILARFDAPLFFANAEVFSAFIRRLVEKGPPATTHLVLAAEPITGIDITAMDELVALDEWLANRGIDLVFAELKGPVKDRVLHFAAGARFGPGHFYPTVSAAVRILGSKRQ